MRNSQIILLFSIALTTAIVGCSDETAHQTQVEKKVSVPKPSPMTASAMAGHEAMNHQTVSVSTEASNDNDDIARRADDLPAPLNRNQTQQLNVDLYTEERVAEIMPKVSYEYWTYNGKVPGPFIRSRVGDQVNVHLSHGKPGDAHQEHSQHLAEQHAAAGHLAHSIDLHTAVAPGGGSLLMQVEQGEKKDFSFKASHPGIYIYHCASPHAPSHIANGMYGMMLVEPAEGLSPVDREFYVMQGDFYTTGKYGAPGFQALSQEKLLMEQPDYFLFNGRVNALTGERALKAKVGEKIRLFVGVGSHIAANFHIVGVIFDKLYLNGAITNPPLLNVQTTTIAPGSAVMIEFTASVPGKYLLVDHSLSRAIDKGAMAELIIEGSK